MTLEFKTGKDLDNFNKKYALNKETGCWDWIASKNKYSYGVFRLNGKIQRAHRISYTNFKGIIPEGLVLDHKVCQNRSCINPEHLEPVTQALNVQRGFQKGETNNLAKLTQVQVDEIRLKYSTDQYTQKELAKEYGVTQPNIGYIVRNERWKES